MIKRDWGLILMVIAFVLNVSLTIINFYSINLWSIGNFFNPVKSTVNCTGKLLDIASCLYVTQGKFYHYNISNVGKNLNISQLMTEGGVCVHYANWYVENAKASGVNAETIEIDVSKNVSHVFALIYSNEGYCLLDQQQKPACAIYETKSTNWSLIYSSNISIGNGENKNISYVSSGTLGGKDI